MRFLCHRRETQTALRQPLAPWGTESLSYNATENRLNDNVTLNYGGTTVPPHLIGNTS